MKIIFNYFFQLSPMLFLHGEPTFITRHFTGGLLPLLIVTFPLAVIGILVLLFQWKKPTSQLLLYLLLLYPIAGAVVADPPFTSRAVIGAPLFAIYIALGSRTIIHLLSRFMAKPLVATAIILAIIINLLQFQQFYFYQYPLYSSDFWGWQYGAKQIVQYFAVHQTEYDQTIMAPEFNAPDIFFKFYAPHDCKKCLIGTPDTAYSPKQKQLFAITPVYLQNHPQYHFKTQKTIYYPNNSVAFLIGEVVQ